MRHATAPGPLCAQKSVRPDRQPGKPVIVILSSPHPVSPSIIQLRAALAGVPVNAHGSYLERDLDGALKRLTAADLAVVTSSIPHNLPGPRMGDDILRAMDARSDMCTVETIPVSTGIVRVYRPTRLGCTASAGG